MTQPLIIAPRLMVETIYGRSFPGYLPLWERQGKTTRFYSSTQLDQLEHEVTRLAPTNDLYIGIATQEHDLGARSRGKASTTVASGSFLIDFDFATSKDSSRAYPEDEERTLEILARFPHQPGILLRTGSGLHGHWLFEELAIFDAPKGRRENEAQRREFARRVSEHFQEAGYQIDPVHDMARVCRIVGTFNHKSRPPKPVEAIRFDPSSRIDPTMFDPPTARGTRAANRSDGPPAHHDRIKRRCAWYAHYTGPGAAACPENDWHALASITGRTLEGGREFHAFSQADPRYDEREASKKLSRGVSEAGPRTCTAIRDAGNEQFCGRCPKWGQITSPLELGRAYDAGAIGPKPFGFTNHGDYALLDQQRQLMLLLSANQLLDGRTQLGLAERSFWQRNFPSPKGGYDTQAAGEAIIGGCREQGPFNLATVKGRGIWLEGDRVIANLGGKIPDDVKGVFLCFEPLKVPEATGFPTARLFKVLEALPWRYRADAMFLLGWLAIAPICGALKQRPHCFVHGPPNSGKTTLQSLATDLARPLGLSADGQSTEAGIRQVLGPDSRPIFIDEYETDNRQDRLAGIMRLARSSYSADAPVLRGTQGGQAIQYSLRTSFFFSAVNVTSMSPADETRIFVLELVSHADDPEVGRFITSERQFFSEMGPQWCAWMVANVTNLVKGVDVFEVAMPALNSRHRTNVATILAGAFAALHGRPPTEAEATSWVAEYGDAISRHSRSHERNDSAEALAHLLGHLVTDGTGMTYPLGHWIARELELQDGRKIPNDLGEAGRIVAIHDMRLNLTGDQPGLMIRNGSPAIDRIFQGSKWANGAWRRALGQLPGAFTLRDPIRFPNSSLKWRAVGLPLEVIPPPMDGRLLNEEF
ncbi:hypothetical protein DJ021_06390 [Phenylobacterium hankyongense]|uniref:SF3 helicase domain-containing protein n=1 Tax=Phenylobacterium hankyongense TaxID=1813876 RepID=A0A328B375_9CAUL|nr:hypothetical protein [Phenylobacterium hankyongense]RAK59458.1 hypothetical protein DJ021_06390 [Phenylobacterium hankyongense]